MFGFITCPNCACTVALPDAPMTPEEVAFKIALERHHYHSFDWWADMCSWDNMRGPDVGTVHAVSGYGQVKLVDRMNSYDFEYGSNPIFVVFEVGDRYFQMNGTASSYGDTKWEGFLKEVLPTNLKYKSWER